jgi:hypothetical protein
VKKEPNDQQRVGTVGRPSPDQTPYFAMRRATIPLKIEVLSIVSPMVPSGHAMDALQPDRDALVELLVGVAAFES